MGKRRDLAQRMSGLSESELLRKESFRVLAVVMMLAGWLTLQVGYSAAPVSGHMWLGVLCMIGGSCAAYVVARSSFNLAGILLVVAMTSSLMFIALAFPEAPLRFFLALVPLSGSLIMPHGGWMSFVLASVSLLGIELRMPDAAGRWSGVGAPLLLGLLTFGLATLLSHSFRTAAAWASQHQRLAQQRTEEARARRAELARAFKALDEAWHRMERMNNELIRARAEAEAARQAKAEFAAHLSHELRTPLNIVLGFSRMMYLSPESYGGEPLPPVYRGDMQAVYRGSQYLSNLVDDVLDLSRSEAGRMTISCRQLGLAHDVVEETVSIVRSLAEAKGLELRVDIDEDLTVHGDPVRLRQVLLNVLNNAIRFTDEGRVVVEAEPQGETVTVSVADTGRGMAADDVEMAFEAFRRVWSPGGVVEGTGLGLAISRELISLHGGRIWADSRIGEGTTVRITLPAGERRAPHSTTTRRANRWAWPTPNHEEERYVVVSPDPLAAQILERHLRDEGASTVECHVIGVEEVDDVSEAVAELHPRVIVVDQRICQNALEVAVMLPYSVPVVVCSVPSEADAGLSLGAMSYLRKPVEEESLLAAVAELGPEVDTVLIVDDDPGMVRLLSRMLGKSPRSYRLVEAFDGEQALALMRQMSPQAVLLDVVMQGKDGFEVLREMKADQGLAHIPVIMVSGAGKSWAEEAEFSLFTVAQRGDLSIQQIAKNLRAVVSSMLPDYLGGRPIVAGSAGTPAG